MILYPPAKINLHLRVLGKRQDGYHNIETIFERVNIRDKIVLRSLKNNKIKIFTNIPSIPVGKKSLMYKTVSLVKDKLDIKKGIEIKIYKKIPIASGLGGGSSDAASILLGLNKLWKLSLSISELVGFARELGADIPFFIKNKSFALGEGIGDKITPLKWKIKLWHLFVFLPIKLRAKDIYDDFSNINSSSLTKRPRLNRILSPSYGDIRHNNIRKLLNNDLEESIFRKAPLVKKVKETLDALGVDALVSGSGPSVFGLFFERKEAQRAQKMLMERLPIAKKKGWQIFIAKTL